MLRSPLAGGIELKVLQSLIPAALLFVLFVKSGPGDVRAQPAPTTILATVISPDGLNLRSSPTLASSVIQTIPYGSVVTLLSAPTADNWYPISFGTLTGWSLGDYLTLGAADPTTALAAAPLSLGLAASLVLFRQVNPVVNSALPIGSARTPSLGLPAYTATASYYGIDDSASPGRLMACGGPFDPLNPAAASTNDWPCGTHLRISGLDGRSVTVTVTDHGQYPAHWVDLTYAAFARLADHRAGTIQVTVEVLP
ncbi:MAG: SH3 domain-containing protein [Dehalococcoidia bacterium]